ncbi:MAG: molybdopterin biosynthesis protein [Thermodesulfovibrionales bacterium]
MKRRIYAENASLDEALRLWRRRLAQRGPLAAETVLLQDALGRITAAPVFAALSSPSYHASAMDGYAVRFSDTFGAHESAPKLLEIGVDAIPVDTGDPLPDGFNAVIMIEDVNPVASEGRDCIEIIGPATPWQHVRVLGEDIVTGELVLPENHMLRPADIAAAIAGGHIHVAVRRTPRVAVIPTGNELIMPGRLPETGEIIDFNSSMLAALAVSWGAEPVRFPLVKDSPEDLKRCLADACGQSDLVVVNAGSSAGSEDFTAAAIAGLGEVILHGVNIKPGKPVILGWVDTTPVLGIPGYPVSAYLTFSLFGREAVYRMQGQEPPPPQKLRARLSRQISSPLGSEEFVRVKLGSVDGTLIATPVSRGAGALMSLVRADGFLRVPEMSEGPGAGTEVEVELMRDAAAIDRTVVCIGSHDNALDLLATLLKKQHPDCSLSSAHVGSMGGLIALKKREAHIAGTHLLDEESGEYNVPFLRRLLPGRKVRLVNLAYREQGLMVRKGNPKKILGVADLCRKDVVFINRQAGSGTRLLTDRTLREAGIPIDTIQGYGREEYTHMGVASAVLSGVADAGMGILAAANSLGLEFIPVAKERYDLAVPEEHLAFEPVKWLIEIVRHDAGFREAVRLLGGYDVSDMGKTLYAE